MNRPSFGLVCRNDSGRFGPHFRQGKSTLWTNAGHYTETFRELWAPLVHTDFGGNSYGPIIGPYLFLGKFVWTNGPESSSKVYPYTGIGPWMALPSLGRSSYEITQKTWRNRNNPLEKLRGNPVKTAPRNCRFLSLVVVERILTSQVLAEVRANFLVWGLTKTLHFINEGL